MNRTMAMAALLLTGFIAGAWGQQVWTARSSGTDGIHARSLPVGGELPPGARLVETCRRSVCPAFPLGGNGAANAGDY